MYIPFIYLQIVTQQQLPRLCNILARLLLEVPEVLRLRLLQITLGHGHRDKRLFNAFAHALGATAHKDAAVDGIDNIPDQIGLVEHLLLDIAALAAPALDDLLDLVLVDAPFAAVDLVDERVPDALEHPDLVCAVCLFQTALDKAAERRNADARANQQHGPVGIELLGERVGHEALEHGDVEGLVLFAGGLGAQEVACLALKEARPDSRAASAAPVRRLVHRHSNLNQAVLRAVTDLVRLVRVVGQRVEARHQLRQHRQQLLERRLRAGEGVQHLRDRNVRAGAEAREGTLALSRAQVVEDLALVVGRGVLSKQAYKLQRRRVRLQVGAPGEKVAAGGEQLARLFVAPDRGPAAAGSAEKDGLVTDEAGHEEGVEDVVDGAVAVGGYDANGSADLELGGLFMGIVCNIEIKVVCSLLGAGLGELAGCVNSGGVCVEGRVRLHKLGRLDACVDSLHVLLEYRLCKRAIDELLLLLVRIRATTKRDG